MSSKTRGPQQRNSDVTDQGNVISGYDTNRSDSTVHEMDLDDSFSRSKMEVTVFFFNFNTIQGVLNADYRVLTKG